MHYLVAYRLLTFCSAQVYLLYLQDGAETDMDNIRVL
jgi:hypothetical protein